MALVLRCASGGGFPSFPPRVRAQQGDERLSPFSLRHSSRRQPRKPPWDASQAPLEPGLTCSDRAAHLVHRKLGEGRRVALCGILSRPDGSNTSCETAALL